MSLIKHIRAREILDSRGWPTLEVDVHLEGGFIGRASVPAGASVGKHEAHILCDADFPKRYAGRGVAKHVVSHLFKHIVPHLLGKDAFDQRNIDAILCELDKHSNKKHLGANCTLAISLATARAQAAALNMPLYRYLGGLIPARLPAPLMNILNGGMHGHNGLAIQEFMVIPVGAATFSQALQSSVEVFHALRDILTQKNLPVSVGDEGGFAPPLEGGTHQALELILTAIEKAGYKPGKDIKLALDAAASTFFNLDTERYSLEDGKSLSSQELTTFWERLVEQYPIVSLEDPMSEDDEGGWVYLTQRIGEKVQVVGDDIFVTQAERLKKGIECGMANAILVKPNQVGTLSETLDTMALAAQHHYTCILSHRSGETEDTFLADLAVATNCPQVKMGGPSRSERLCKYNQLLRIEELMAPHSGYAIPE